ncbi:MAG: septum site-determining protein MinC [Anaerolineaceae bacterium]|nr:septum site-determining protein MinC [Anaerolineaceae bacterium]
MATIDQQSQIQIKGFRNGLLITVGEGEWDFVRESLIRHVEEQGAFFKGAKVAVDVGPRLIHAAELGALRDQLSDLEVVLWGVLSNHETTENTARSLGLATRLGTANEPKQEIKTVSTQFDGEAGIVVQRTMRSGYKIMHPGHVTVIGDVNPGAEIIAGGSIVVWGRLRGLVHAGADGNQEAVICALDLNPRQLRIADLITVPPNRKKGEKVQPEIARIVNHQVVAEFWNIKT